MKVFYSYDNLPPFWNAVVTVGSFDGLHRGHRELLDRLTDVARKSGGESVVATFSPHPRQVLARGGDVKLLNTLKEKIYLLRETGIDNLVILPFDSDFAALSADDFVRRVLVGEIGMKHFVAGFDHRFGRGQQGDAASIEDMSAELDFTLHEVPKYSVDDHKVSSTMVRDLIAGGRMEDAAEMLAHRYIVIGEVKNGSFIVGEAAKLLPPPGRYAVSAESGGELHEDTLSIDSAGNMKLQNVKNDVENVIVTFL